MKYANATLNTRVYDKFEYYLEDFDCIYCVHFQSNVVAKHSDAASRCGSHGCGRSVCEFTDIKDEAIRQNRLKRAKGWNKICLE
jgi:hypothetical protein